MKGMKRLTLAALLACLVPLVGAQAASAATYSIDYGNVAVNTTSADIGTVITNDTGQTIYIDQASTPPWWTPDTGSGCWTAGPIEPGGSCIFTGYFKPTAIQSYSGTVTVGDSNGDTVATIDVSGNGVAPTTFSFSPSPVDFGSVQVGTKQTTDVTVTVSGTADYYAWITGVSLGGNDPGDFTATPDSSCTAGVAPPGTCTIAVSFDPSAAGSRSATLKINYDAPPAGSQTITLEGTGTKASTAITSAASYTSGYNDSVTVSGTLKAGTTPVQNATLSFTLDSNESCTGTTNASGVASCSITLTRLGRFALNIAYAGDATHKSSSHSVPFTVTLEDTALAYTGPVSGDYHDPVTLQATLTDATDHTGIAGRTVTLGFGAESCSGTTGSDGVASCSVTPTEAPGGGPYPITASFATDGYYAAASDSSHSFTVTPEETVTQYTGPQAILAGHSAVLSGRLLEDGITPVPGRALTLSAGAESCTALTNAAGDASCSVTVSAALGTRSVSASFGGDGDYLQSSSAAGSAVVFAFPSSGAFVVGDQTAGGGPGTAVTYFGYQWSAQNQVSGDPGGGSSLGGGDSGFDGFAADISGLPTGTPAGSCSGTWSTSQTQFGAGSLSALPASVPSYMGVLVTGDVTASGWNFSGDFQKIVVVRTNPDYSTNPATAATGTIVATYCG